MPGPDSGRGKRAPDETPEEHLAYLIARVHHRIQQAMDRALRTVGTTPTQFYALAHIAQAPGLSSADLARGLLTTPQAAATLVKRMETAGLLERAGQGRGLPSAVSLSDAGRAKLRSAVDVAVAAETEALSSISAADQKRIGSIMQSLLEGLEQC